MYMRHVFDVQNIIEVPTLFYTTTCTRVAFIRYNMQHMLYNMCSIIIHFEHWDSTRPCGEQSLEHWLFSLVRNSEPLWC